MMETELVTRVDRLIDATNRLGTVSSTSGVHIHAGGMIAIAVGLVGTLAIVVAVSCVLIVAAWRSADMSSLASLRRQVGDLEAYRQVQSDRINKLEAANGGR